MKLKYKSELIRSMNMLSKHKKTIFLGQSVKYSGNAIFNTLKNIPDHKKIELPVFEDVQMGMSIGLSLNGFIPITCYPRFDFLVLAFNQMVNHLDKIQQMSNKQFQPKIIIRTSIGSKKPLDGGPQHTQDYTKIFKSILSEIEVIMLSNPKNIYKTYKNCIKKENKKSYLIIEHGDFYNDR
jgi:pyruvate/2-oxoglutarate/acetoin dehydrogenase E1 component